MCAVHVKGRQNVVEVEVECRDDDDDDGAGLGSRRAVLAVGGAIGSG